MDLVATTKGAVPRHDPAKTAVPTSARHLASDVTMMRLMPVSYTHLTLPTTPYV